MTQSEHRQDKSSTYHHGDLRAALIAAAEDLLAEKGAEGFTLRECARRAGVSPAAPSHHFGNAAGLLAAIATLGFEELSDEMEAALAAAGPGRAGRLRAIGAAYVAFALRRPGRFRVTFGSAGEAQKVAAGVGAAGARAFGILQREVTAGTDPASTRAATVLAWSVVHGLSMLLLDGKLGFLLDEAAPARDQASLVEAVVALMAGGRAD